MNASALSHVVIAGAGTMGASLAQIFAQAGIQVTLWNRSQAGLDRAAALIRSNQSALVAAGRLSADDSNALMERIVPTTEDACFPTASFLLESIAEDLTLKQDFFRRISTLVPVDCILTTNTSGLSISAIGSTVAEPGRFCGMHWINPPHLVPLVEVIQGTDTGDGTMDFVYALAQRLRKKPIRAKDLPGFIMNRLQLALLREALALVDSGAATAEDVDAAVKYGLGLRYACVGPFETMDLGGVDIFCRIASYLLADLDDRKDTPPLLQTLTEQGACGVKSGHGFYDYSGEKAAAALENRDQKFIRVLDALGL
ncbi:MAG: 3-hydroxyacyl-CoA dehydrogenase family protein [Dysosmobacter sp.]|nr:3-hydroxyacyl-CoA dehydrogenase family protein [Dysosmobacter sp.]